MIPDSVPEALLAGVAALWAAIEARQARKHTKPNGTGKSLIHMVEEINKNVTHVKVDVEQIKYAQKDVLEWQGRHEAKHIREQAEENYSTLDT